MPYRLDIENDFVLVFTATIDIQGMGGVSRPDPLARQRDYSDSLHYYLHHHPRVRKLVFIENSGWPLDSLQSLAATDNPLHKQVEFVSLKCNDFPRELGKSYGELLLLDQGIGASRICAETRYLSKITGRNILLNLTRILERVDRPFALLCDLHDHALYDLLDRATRRIGGAGRRADTRFFAFNHDFFNECLAGQYKHERERNYYFIENLIYDLAKSGKYKDQTIRRFAVEQHFRGTAGHGHGKDYDGFKESTKRRIRAVARKIAPWFHL